MAWIKAEYEFASLFSYRIPGFSSQYALTSLIPGPSTIKLALVATAIRSTGSTKSGERVFKKIRDAAIAISPPKRIAVSNVLIRRLKKKRGKVGLGFEETFGIRGYAHFSNSIKIYVNVKEEDKDEIKNILSRIRQLGSYDSIVSCKGEPLEEEAPLNCIRPLESLERVEKNILLIPVKDINPDPAIKFEDVNPYYINEKRRKKKEIFINKFYPLNVAKCELGKNWIIYELE
jgi:CRISPR-associated protein Cas5 subtype I-A